MAATASVKPRMVTEDESRWLTRNEASDLLGVSVQTIMKHERADRLHPRIVRRTMGNNAQRDVYVLDPFELLALPRRGRIMITDDPDELCARAFELMDRGMNKREIVIELRVSITRVVDLYEQWLDAGGSEMVVGKEARKAIEAAIGPFQTVTELAERIAAKMAPAP